MNDAMQTDLIKRIKKEALALKGDEKIDDVVKAMIKEGVSSAIIMKDDKISGIVTERDILRRLATLDVERHLDRPIRVLMSYPVEFVYLDTLLDDVKRLHFDKKRRHFPILKSRKDGNESSNFLGILTSTDICRAFLDKAK